jgi:hypothetical protein
VCCGRERGWVAALALDCEACHAGELGSDVEGERVLFGADEEDLRLAVSDYVGYFGG